MKPALAPVRYENSNSVGQPRAFEVAVDHRARAGAAVQHRRARAQRHHRADAVGAHGEARGRLEAHARRVARGDARDPALRVDAEPIDGHAEADLDAGRSSRLDHDRVEHGAARSVERVDARLGLDLDGVDRVAVAHHVLVHRRRAGGDHRIEQAPALELEHAGPHQGVGRQRVGPGAAAIDQENATAAAREQHRGGGAGDPGADHDGVVLGGLGSRSEPAGVARGCGRGASWLGSSHPLLRDRRLGLPRLDSGLSLASPKGDR